MADVTSKNRYELLGNDPDEDSDQGPKAPTKAIDKTLPRSGKRVPGSEPVARASDSARGGRGGRRGGQTGSEAAYNDSGAGSRANRAKPAEEGGADRAPRRGGMRNQRGGRGGSFKDPRDDRHSKGLPHDHQKQANQSWGGATGNSEWADERAGEAIAQNEAAEGGAPAEGDADAEVEEDNSKTYDDFRAEQEAKRATLGQPLAARKANEGSKQDKKWAKAKALHKDEEEDNYMAPQGGKTARQRERKEKQVVEIDHRFVEPPRERGAYRGGRGGGRGGRGDGEGRGDGGGRGGGRGRAEFRGARGAGEGRGGGRGRGGANVNVSDTRAFPSLGS